MAYAHAHDGGNVQAELAPMLKLYLESIEAWKRNYEAIADAARSSGTTAMPHGAASPVSMGMDQSMERGADLFRRFVEAQIELCRFYGKRWEQYLNLPDQISRCRTPADLGQVQMRFLSDMAADYARESMRLAQPMNEAMTGWTARGRLH
jgi:hypothetical protein